MRTTTSISPLEASKLLGLSKTTITRAIKDGKLTAFKAPDGRLWVEPSELSRAFPEETLAVHTPMHETADATSRAGSSSLDKSLQDDAEGDDRTGVRQQGTDVLWRELADLARQRDEARSNLHHLREERERERRHLEETVSDLRGRLDASEGERRQMTERVTALLTDQRAKADVKPRRWWRRRAD